MENARVTHRLQRVPARLVEMIEAVAWFERKTFGEVLEELAGGAISERFSALPDGVKQRQPYRPPTRPEAASPSKSN